MQNKTQIRFATVRENSVNEEARTAEFVISTEAVDSYNTVFKAAGWDFTRYNANPVVTFQHDDHSSDPNMVIGTSEIRLEDGKTIATVTFEDFEDNELSKKVFRKVKNNILRGASIRADIKDGRLGDKNLGEKEDVVYFTRQDLVAWSIVTIPSNPEALKRNMESLEDFKNEIKPTASPEVVENRMSVFEAQLITNKNKL
jgi:hypothetical protein